MDRWAERERDGRKRFDEYKGEREERGGVYKGGKGRGRGR